MENEICLLRPVSRFKYLVFTSAGDASNVRGWLSGREFDLWVCYYGEGEDSLADIADHYFERKGGKVQNFYYALAQWRDQLAKYDAILLADDDIIISGGDINRLFSIREEYALKVLQPAFDLRGKNSHKLTEPRPLSKLRYVNFVEIGFPLFERKALLQFMEIYAPAVNCWGVDWWYSYFIKKIYGNDSLAICDEILALNPFDRDKPKGSEIEKLSSVKKLAEDWESFSLLNGIVTEKGTYITYKKLVSYRIDIFLSYCFMWFSFQMARLVKKI